MFGFVITAFCLVSVSLFKFKNKIWDEIKHKYYSTKKIIQRFKNLSTKLQTRSNTSLIIHISKLKLIIQTIKEFIIFKLRTNTAYYLETGLIKSDGKEYEIVYYNGDIRYKIRFLKRRGVKQIHDVESHLGVNVTSEILELMGPGLNFYGIPTTPLILGWKEGLLFKYVNSQEVFYNTNDIIKLNL